MRGPCSCDDARGLMAEMLDSGLEPTARALLDAHLATCSRCASVMEEQRQLDELLAGMEAPPPSDGFTDRVVRALDRAPGGTSRRTVPAPDSLRRALSSTVALAAAAAAAALLVPEAATASVVEALSPAASVPALGDAAIEEVRRGATLRMEEAAALVPSGVFAAGSAVALLLLVVQVLWFRSRSPGATS